MDFRYPIPGGLDEPQREPGEGRRVRERGEIRALGDLDVSELGVELDEAFGEDGAALSYNGALEGYGEGERLSEECRAGGFFVT